MQPTPRASAIPVRKVPRARKWGWRSFYPYQKYSIVDPEGKKLEVQAGNGIDGTGLVRE